MTEKAQYTTQVTVEGGREGKARSYDGNLDVVLTMPKEFGGPGGEGTNPEQLFAAAWAGCFLSATKLVARLNKVTLKEDPTIKATISVYKDQVGYFLAAALNVSMPGVERDVAEKLVEGAHQRCPFSRATQGNVHVTITVE